MFSAPRSGTVTRPEPENNKPAPTLIAPTEERSRFSLICNVTWTSRSRLADGRTDNNLQRIDQPETITLIVDAPYVLFETHKIPIATSDTDLKGSSSKPVGDGSLQESWNVDINRLSGEIELTSDLKGASFWQSSVWKGACTRAIQKF